MKKDCNLLTEDNISFVAQKIEKYFDDILNNGFGGAYDAAYDDIFFVMSTNTCYRRAMEGFEIYRNDNETLESFYVDFLDYGDAVVNANPDMKYSAFDKYMSKDKDGRIMSNNNPLKLAEYYCGDVKTYYSRLAKVYLEDLEDGTDLGEIYPIGFNKEINKYIKAKKKEEKKEKEIG